MDEQTSIVTKTELSGTQEETNALPKDSTVGGISVRALIAIILVSTVCAMSICYAIIDVAVSINSKTLPTFSIQEPLYSGFMVAIGAYLGKALANGVKK